MPTALRGHGGLACPRKAVGMAPGALLEDWVAASRERAHKKTAGPPVPPLPWPVRTDGKLHDNDTDKRCRDRRWPPLPWPTTAARLRSPRMSFANTMPIPYAPADGES